ncbi:DUF190 domain-containing protein [Halodesulfovibrio aestuarii]|uniref:DUF190 domain-containing protein n=1 Tax=Halodesulfovibrio aestuarii TaxID=126333 RepID=UPI0004144D98
MKECTNVERITCIIDEDRTHNGEPLYRAIVEQAQKNGIAGATVHKGIMGYGAAKTIHRERPLGRSSDVPVIIHMVDDKEKLDAFSNTLCEMVPQGIVLREPVSMCLVRCGGKTLE